MLRTVKETIEVFVAVPQFYSLHKFDGSVRAKRMGEVRSVLLQSMLQFKIVLSNSRQW